MQLIVIKYIKSKVFQKKLMFNMCHVHKNTFKKETFVN